MKLINSFIKIFIVILFLTTAIFHSIGALAQCNQCDKLESINSNVASNKEIYKSLTSFPEPSLISKFNENSQDNSDFQWRLVGSEYRGYTRGDFNGDGNDDLMYTNLDGRSYLHQYLNSDGSVLEEREIFQQTDMYSWSVVGFYDLNNDGRDDILWKNLYTRDLVSWLTKSNGYPEGFYAVDSKYNPSSDWGITAYNDDLDILFWRHTDGYIYSWKFKDGKAVSGKFTVKNKIDKIWRIVGSYENKITVRHLTENYFYQWNIDSTGSIVGGAFLRYENGNYGFDTSQGGFFDSIGNQYFIKNSYDPRPAGFIGRYEKKELYELKNNQIINRGMVYESEPEIEKIFIRSCGLGCAPFEY